MIMNHKSTIPPQICAHTKTLVKQFVNSSVTTLFNMPYVKHEFAACCPKLPRDTKHCIPKSEASSKHEDGSFGKHGGQSGKLLDRHIAKSCPVKLMKALGVKHSSAGFGFTTASMAA